MANHAHIVVEELPSFEEADKLIREFTAEKFPMLEVEPLEWEETGWFIKLDDYNGVTVWFSTVSLSTEEGWDDEYDADKISKHPCFEFRHGHGFTLFWWIEREFRSLLAHNYNGMGYDEGYSSYVLGDFESPESSFDCYYDYLMKTRIEDRTEMAKAKGHEPEAIEDTNQRILAFEYSELLLREKLVPLWGGPVPEKYDELFGEKNE
jgi:hypothetical protein